MLTLKKLKGLFSKPEMSDAEYVRLAVSTESNDFDAIRARLSTPDGAAALVSALERLSTLAEAVDGLKKSAFYGRQVELSPELKEPQDAELIRVVAGRLSPKMIRNLHATLGLATEVGELVDAVRAELIEGKPLDTVNVMEEVGDKFWYLGVLADNNGFTFAQSKARNIEKLAKRFKGGKFSSSGANKRDLSAERKILEKK